MSGLHEPTLNDGFVLVRRWCLDDLPLVAQASVPEEGLLRGSTLPRAYTPEEGEAFIERQWSRASSGQGLALAIEVEGEAVGVSRSCCAGQGSAILVTGWCAA